MSTTHPDIQLDLIDFHVGSPVLPRRSSITEIQFQPESENLIDTELPIFEQKLQTAPNTISCSNSRRTSIDVEDILINIDSEEEYETDSLEEEKVDFLDVCDGLNNVKHDDNETVLPVDNFEALLVLKNLDDLLNATLEASETVLDSINSNCQSANELEDSEENSQHNIEECLEDLDTYLKAIEDEGDTEENTQHNIEECLEDLDTYLKAIEDEHENKSESSQTSFSADDESCTGRSSSLFGYAVGSSLFDEQEDSQEEFNEELARQKLRKIENNYSRFVASGIVNRGYVDTENNANCTLDGQLRRPSSACALTGQPWSRKHPLRAATLAVVGKERPRLFKRRKSLNENNSAPYSTLSRRTSFAADATRTTPENWLTSRDVTSERHAHASADRCTGTVIVEPLQRQSKANSSSVSAVDEVRGAEVAKEEARRTLRGTWLRSSMRRLQHLNLPSTDVSEGESGGVSVEVDVTRLEVPPSSVRPVSAPSRLPPIRTPTARSSRSRSRESVSHEPNGRARSSSSSQSRRQRSLSSSVTSLASSVGSTLSRMPSTEADRNGAAVHEATANADSRRPCDHSRDDDMPDAESPLGKWPHSLSSMMACLGCTLGLFNISRFAILSIHFGANFIFQFLLLSLVFGLPLFTLQLCLGQQLGAGVIDMWRISPLFQGVGVALLITQALTGLYSIIGVSWMFVYFRDAFITTVDQYRWAEPFLYYRKDIQPPVNGTYRLQETIPDYFNGIVLQRYHLPSGIAYGTIKFQLAFNLAVVWMIVFVSLSKGLRSYGKVIYVFTLLPVFGTFVLCAKILGLMPPEFLNVIFPETSWGEFFLNSRSWLAAAQEAFLTWGLMGAAIMQIASHNKHKHLLQRDSSLVAVMTISVLLLVAFLANTCVQILKSYGYLYYPSSFERMSSYHFMRFVKDPLPPSLANTPVRYMIHNSFILGEKVIRSGVDSTHESGYQVLRLATELLPATFAVLGADQVSPFWAVLTYFIFIMFGIAQQLAIWHCVITGIMAIKAKVLKSWETTITFFSCSCGFILGLPMATELGIYVVYFMDYTLGSIWWLTIVIFLQIVAVFMVRGRPYSGDTIVKAMFSQTNSTHFFSWAPALLSFTWNVILPVILMVLCVSTFKNGSFRDMFIWHHAPFTDYWPLWSRQIGSMMQLLPVLCVPFVAVIQSYRYLNNGPVDILDRIQLLYRPPIGEHMEDPPIPDPTTTTSNATTTTNIATEDPPPKYTPPPSYTTATGARLAKFLRQSIRRSMRRIANVLGESSAAGTSRSRPSVVRNGTDPPPPDYNAVFVEMSNTSDVALTVTDSPARVSTLERLRNLQSSPTALSAADVASILRSSFRRSTVRSPNRTPRDETFADNSVASLSAEHLVDAAAPIGETSLVMDQLSADIERQNKTLNNSSVI